MKLPTHRTVFCSLAIACIEPGYAQGTFQNLDFEAAMLVPVVINGLTYVEFGPAFPGWTGYFDSTPFTPTTLVNYNGQNINTSAFGIVDRNYAFGGIANFTALLQGGFLSEDRDVTLAQTGLIPSGSMSLRFHADRLFDARPFEVTIDGELLTPVVLQDFGSFQEYGADISAFSGQTVELRFAQGHGPANFNNFFLDNVSFSQQPVPEPSTWALLALGGALFWCAARRRRR